MSHVRKAIPYFAVLHNIPQPYMSACKFSPLMCMHSPFKAFDVVPVAPLCSIHFRFLSYM